MAGSTTPINTGSAHAVSVVGRKRTHNEDSVLARQWPVNRPGPGRLEALLAVADGMGGHERGEWASSTALSVLRECLKRDADAIPLDAALSRAFAEINQTIYTGGDTGPSHPGTTLTVALVAGDVCTFGHVGDSRLYLFRAGYLRQLTEDDSWAAELVRQGQMTAEDADNWAHRHQLTRAVGIRPNVEASISTLSLQPRDVLLLCSDGLSGMLQEEGIANAIASSSSVVQAGEMLCADANEAGGEDNISAVIYSHRGWPSHAQAPVPGPSAAGAGPACVAHLLSRPLFAALAILVLAGAGLWFLLAGPHKSSGGGSPNHGATLVPRAGAATPSSPDLQSSPNPDARLRIWIDSKNRLLHVETIGSTLHGIPLRTVPKWDAAGCEYRLGRSTRDSALSDGSAFLKLQGVETARVKLDETLSWETPIRGSAAYQLVWIDEGTHPIAAFRAEAPHP